MTENLLEAPERDTIEALLTKSNAGLGQAPTFDRLLGFISGAVITPDFFEASDWLQPLFDLNGIVFVDVEDIELFTDSVISLYNRADALRLRGERLCPFDLPVEIDFTTERQPVFEWAKGLHLAVSWQEDIWIPYEGDADYIDESLRNEVNLNIQVLAVLADPSQIPEIVKDPVPFQRNILSECPFWNKEVRDTWDEELMVIFKYFSLGRLHWIMDSLQRYATVYDEPEIVVIGDPREVPGTPVIPGT